MQFFNVSDSLYDVVVGMEIVDVLESCHSELDEVFVVVDNEDSELHGRRIQGCP